MNDGTDFVGTGWAFPLRVAATGGIALTSASEEIDASLRVIMATMPGERVMRPDFGCAIWDLVFASTDANALGLMAQAVRQAVGRWESRVELERVVPRVDPDDPTRVLIDIAYVIKATNDRRNLVYPFYTIPAEGRE